MPLAVPDWVLSREFDRAREEQADEHLAEAKRWSGELKRIDPYLELVWVHENATEPDLEPARWHIRRRNPETLDSYWPLVGDQGEYREPGEWMLHELHAKDLWNPRVHRNWKEARQKLREVKEREASRKAEQRRDEMALSVRAAKRLRGESQFTKSHEAKRQGKGLKK